MNWPTWNSLLPKQQDELTEENLARIRNETSINDCVQVRLPAELTQADIDRIIDCFAGAAERCLRAGMDMVLIHGAHEMLISQFLSRIRISAPTNTAAP